MIVYAKFDEASIKIEWGDTFCIKLKSLKMTQLWNIYGIEKNSQKRVIVDGL